MTPRYLYKIRIHKLNQDVTHALENGDPDAIHDVRVSIRRLLMLCSLLKLSGKAPYSKKELQIIKNKFKKAGMLRDIQVQRQWLGLYEKKLQQSFGLYQRYLERREQILRGYFTTAFMTIRFKKAIPDTVSRLSFRQNIEKQLTRLEEDFRKRSRVTHALHPLRITAKKLKYTLEIQQACYPGFGVTENFRKYLAHLQDLLGAWHDLETGLHHVSYLVKRHKNNPDDLQSLNTLITVMKNEKEKTLLDAIEELKKKVPMCETLSVVLS